MAETMGAIRSTAGGALEWVEVPRPQPGGTEVLIRVEAAGVNPADWKSIEPSADGDAPVVIPGWDIAGTVVELGPGVTRFEVGDRVFGMPRFPERAGAYAQFATSRSREIARIPDGVDTVTAGAVPLAGLTAWQAVVDTLGVESGDRVLVHAAAGGVGHLAVQIAKARGAEVWGTASERNHGRLRELGVDHCIDYRTERFEDVADAMDAVVDLVGDGETSRRSLACLRRGGQLVAISPVLPEPDLVADAGVTARFMLVEPDESGLESLAAMLADGSLEVVIAATQEMSSMSTLHSMARRGGSIGKYVATL
ncbi:NADP-dependent oxidoreductase [Demequina rhizosphaerae]|uniref:NADP-dependent oxidoreductase n=1 Tax=Demequina rhizosphaerae TaxID=1638985 RepID=UPI000AC825F7|nr:NADP-dependent oxidoreductase [Demequina rhizosphaerae]